MKLWIFSKTNPGNRCTRTIQLSNCSVIKQYHKVLGRWGRKIISSLVNCNFTVLLWYMNLLRLRKDCKLFIFTFFLHYFGCQLLLSFTTEVISNFVHFHCWLRWLNTRRTYTRRVSDSETSSNSWNWNEEKKSKIHSTHIFMYQTFESRCMFDVEPLKLLWKFITDYKTYRRYSKSYKQWFKTRSVWNLTNRQYNWVRIH